MSGHSKWATTKHKKAAIDAKRGKLFAKLIKNIEVAARPVAVTRGQPDALRRDPEGQEVVGPQHNIDNAVKRGSGATAGGADWETITYEGYAPGGVAILIECLTDNRNRAAAEVRTALTRNGGALADPGSVTYVFDRKGVVVVPKGDKPRTTSSRSCSRPAPRRSTTTATPGRSSPRPPTSSPCAPRCRRPASTTTRPRPRGCRTSRCPLDLDGAKKMIRVVEALEDSTTCRTSSPTATRCWPARRGPRAPSFDEDDGSSP